MLDTHPNKQAILVVDDDEALAGLCCKLFDTSGYSSEREATGIGALKAFKKRSFDLLLLDIRLPDTDGITLAKEIKALHPNLPIILMSGFSSLWENRNVGRSDVHSFVPKPFDHKVLIRLVDELLKKEGHDPSHINLDDSCLWGITHKMGNSEEIQDIASKIDKIADDDCSVLITGETGTGKELVAHCLHDFSSRRDKPFVALDCGAIPSTLLEAELFGSVKGAFTGALVSRKGKFETAHNGTLFLDEINNLSLEAQAKLLRVLEEKEINRVGSSEFIKVDVRIVAASNVDLQTAVFDKHFREDLYYRLNGFQIGIPPLRERNQSIHYLANYLLRQISAEKGVVAPKLSEAAVEILLNHSWSGNFRELRSVIYRLVLNKVQTVTPEHLEFLCLCKDTQHVAPTNVAWSNDFNLKNAVDRATAEVEQRLILKALKKTDWNRTQTAKLLGIDRKTLRAKMARFEILR